ncbi:hypothetical protein Tco_1488077, partial [Tanacetum coccineum]
ACTTFTRVCPEPIYPEFMPPKDKAFPVKEQPLPAAVSPTADSPGYIADSVLEEDEEDLEEDPKEDTADYPTDRGDDDDDDDDESSDDDEYDDDDDVEEGEDEEEEEHIAPTDSVTPHVHRVTTMIAAMIRLRAKSPSTSHPLPSSTPPSGTPPLLPIPLPISSPPLLLPSTVCRAGVFEVTLPPRKRLCIALGLRYKVSDSSSGPTARPTGGFKVDYGCVGTLDDEIRQDRTPAATDVAGLSQRMIDFVTTVRHDIDGIYVRLDDAQDDRSLMSGQLNMLRRDRHAHCHTRPRQKREA